MGLFSLFSQSLANEKYVFFDLETTGLNPLQGDKIVEIAVIKTHKGKVIDTFSTMINPEMPIPESATKINNITNDMVKDSPVFDNDFCSKIIDQIQDSILIAHNASFDLGFLSIELGRNGITFERWKSIDTLKIANKLFAGQKNKLENIMRRYNIMPDGTLHRAFSDTDILRKIYFELIEESEIRSMNIDEMLKEFGYQGNNVQRFIPAIIREAIIEKKILNGQYRTRDNNLMDLSVLPISSVWYDGKWYLFAKRIDNKQSIFLFCDNYFNVTI